MKRILILAVLLVGCQRLPDAQRPNPDGTTLNLYRDMETGCQYLGQRSGNAGITARIASDGKTHMGCKAVAP